MLKSKEIKNFIEPYIFQQSIDYIITIFKNEDEDVEEIKKKYLQKELYE